VLLAIIRIAGELPVADKCFIDGCKAKPMWWAETPLGLVYSCSEHKHHLAGFKSQGPLDQANDKVEDKT
jgi:hypothetical protein